MGIDINFRKILKILREINNEFPDLRFGHVIQTAIDNHKTLCNIDLHDRSSKEMLKALKKFQDRTRIARGKK